MSAYRESAEKPEPPKPSWWAGVKKQLIEGATAFRYWAKMNPEPFIILGILIALVGAIAFVVLRSVVAADADNAARQKAYEREMSQPCESYANWPLHTMPARCVGYWQPK